MVAPACRPQCADEASEALPPFLDAFEAPIFAAALVSEGPALEAKPSGSPVPISSEDV